MENRSFDNLAGYYNHTKDIDNLIQYEQRNGSPFCNPLDVAKGQEGGQLCASNNSPNVQRDDPDHGLPGVMIQQFGRLFNDSSLQPEIPPMNGFIQDNIEAHHSQSDPTRSQKFIAGLDVSLVQYTYELARNFVLFDRFFGSVPGPTNPNRAFATSGTSHGFGDNQRNSHFNAQCLFVLYLY
jgi:phospholipase C